MTRAGPAAIVVLLAALGRPAAADEPARLVWIEGDQLRVRPLEGDAVPGAPDALAIVPGAQVRAIEVARDGSALLLDLDGPAIWVDLSREPSLVGLPCRGGARLAPDGGRVACAARGGQAIFRLRPSGPAVLLPGAGPRPAAFADAAGEALVVVTDGGLVRRRAGAADEPLGPVPSTALSVAPGAERAVGRFAGEESEALSTFRLGGDGTRRKLLPGIPVTWSADGAWLLVETGTATCAVRAVGGEYKCWDGFHGRALATDGAWAILSRDHAEGGSVDLFLAAVHGAQTRPPRPLRSGVPGPAAILP